MAAPCGAGTRVIGALIGLSVGYVGGVYYALADDTG